MAVLGGGAAFGGGEDRLGKVVRGGGQRGGEAGGVFYHALPGLEGVLELVFLAYAAERGQHELGDVGEGFGFFDGDAVLG
jgi:hypothetical protein